MRLPDRESAQLYVSVHDGAPGDVDYYRRHVEGQRVLELGSGTGRVTLALAEVAQEVVGLELEAGMVAEARARREALPEDARARVRFVAGDMSDFDLGRRFDRVVIPFSGLYCMLDPASLARCFEAARRHVEEDGRLLFDGYAADRFHAEASPDDHPDDDLDEVAEIEHAGETLRVMERSTWDPATQRMDATYVYETEEGAVRRQITVGHRYVLGPQVAPTLEAAGFELLRLDGGFEGEPFDGQSGLVVEARPIPSR